MALTLSRNALACGLEGQETLANPALMNVVAFLVSHCVAD